MTASEKCMLGFVLVFLANALWPSLPKISLIACAILILICLIKYSKRYFLKGALLGFIWASISGYAYIHWQFPSQFNQQNLVVEGVIDSIVPSNIHDSDTVYINFVADKLGKSSVIYSPKLRLSWFGANKTLQQGQRWRLFVKLKSAVGLANREGFNYQKWLASKNLVATGYVKDSPSNTLLKNEVSNRQALINDLDSYELMHEKWIKALMYGDRSGLETPDWQLLQNTGTAHLFAISGMHLGIVLAAMLWLGKGLVIIRSVNGSAWQYNVKPLNVCFAVAVCCYYAYLAGFQVPVMRALLGAILFCSLLMLQRYWRMQASLLVLLSLFIILFPYAHLGISFWFSFIAVGLIWFYSWRWPMAMHASRIQVLLYGIKLQCFLSFATMPMIAFGFGAIPLTSMFANIVAIPVVTLLLVPLCLISALMQSVSLPITAMLHVLDNIFEVTLIGLAYFNQFPVLKVADLWIINSHAALALLLSLSVLLAMPGFLQRKVLVFMHLVALIIVAFIHFKREQASTWQLYVFDIGQGSAMVIEANQKYIIYDTGASFRGSFSMAESVLLPFFESKKMPTIDHMILSHLDIDHAGGQHFLNSRLHISRMMSPADYCNVGNNFRWQGIQFTILWPETPQSGDENAHSCVIKIDDGIHSVLFSGDIEHKTEKALIEKYSASNSQGLKANILIVPHHGSKSSSSLAFIKAVQPEYAVVSSGYQNRWEFPAAQVVKRYQKQGVTLFNTGNDGQITFVMSPDNISISRYRIDEYRRWYFKAP